MLTVAGDEDPARLVDPDLLDLGVLEQRRQGAEAEDPLAQQVDLVVGERREPAVEVPVAVVGDDLVDERPERVILVERELAPDEQLAHVGLDLRERAAGARSRDHLAGEVAELAQPRRPGRDGVERSALPHDARERRARRAAAPTAARRSTLDRTRAVLRLPAAAGACG